MTSAFMVTVLLQPLDDGEIARRDQRQIRTVGAGVLDAQDDRADIRTSEVDRRVGIDRIQAQRRCRVLLERLRRRRRRRRSSVADRGAFRGAELLHDANCAVTREAHERCTECGEDALVPGLPVVITVVAATDHWYALAEQEAVREERER